jgi:ubiquitin C-terminal hydrolase
VQRFAGFGQQDSAELVNFLVDLLHEDCNRVKKKPFIEMSEEEGRPDTVVAKEYWDAYIARNKSIIVDLMMGQLKSTVTCITCGWVTVAFDPMSSIQVPIPRVQYVDIIFVPYKVSTEPDENGDVEVAPMYILDMALTKNMIIRDIREKWAEKMKIPIENLLVASRR